MRRAVATALPLLLLTGCGAASAEGAGPSTPEATSAQSGELDDPFFTYDREAEYEVVEERVSVPVRDGAEIACDLLRPDADEKFPGIVYEYTAYAESVEDFANDAEYFAQRGYSALVCQARGSGDSPGELDPFGPREQEDNYDVIEWLASQDHSTGRIGQMGLSYGGHTSLLAAVNQPPHLEAIIPINGLSDWYENTIYRGGI
jgi:predicted acyl esterase